MPEQIRLKVGGVTSQQMAVYEEFARNIPGFLPLTDRDAAMFIPKSVVVGLIHIADCRGKMGNDWWKLYLIYCCIFDLVHHVLFWAEHIS
jgi:CCR4-NOT transcription complex subunit 1